MTREEAISRINNDLECHKKELSAPYKTALNMAIEALKFQEVYNVTINAVNKYYDEHHAQILSWTPCSERLPGRGEYYLVTRQYFGWNCTEYREIDIAKYDFDGWHKADNVLAWCELPKPYQEDNQ